MTDYLALVQWPAMLVTVFSSWLVGSTHRHRRTLGFWLFLLSNVLWCAWGWHTHSIALVVLQACLAVMNIRGAFKGASAKR
jgi:hypothetical protein